MRYLRASGIRDNCVRASGSRNSCLFPSWLVDRLEGWCGSKEGLFSLRREENVMSEMSPADSEGQVLFAL